MTIRLFLLSAFLLFACSGGAGKLTPDASMVRPLASTNGGLDGEIVRVTTLAAEGPGSLRAALAIPRPRLIVFDIAGVIDLGGRTLTVKHPHATIAGQTAPDPGITLIRGSLVIETHDVVVQHLAVRPGDNGRRVEGWAPDAINVRHPAHHVLIENCSATWAVDENLSTSGPADVEGDGASAHDITLRRCLIAEGLSQATHPKGEHSKGTLVHDGVRGVEIVECVYAHNRERNPRLKGGTSAVIANNVMYDWGSAAIGVGARGNERELSPATAAIVGNFAIPGPSSKAKTFVRSVDPGARLFLRDNTSPLPLVDAGVVVLPSWPAALPPPVPLADVLRRAGSRPARRDPIDARIVQSVADRTGRIIDSQEEVGGYPVRASSARALTVPADRRAWLDALSRELTEPGPAAAR